MMTVLGVMVCMCSLPVNWWSYPRHLDTDLCGIVDFECVWADRAYGALTVGPVVDDLDVLEHHLAHCFALRKRSAWTVRLSTCGKLSAIALSEQLPFPLIEQRT